jgi:hypothetical protein
MIELKLNKEGKITAMKGIARAGDINRLGLINASIKED